MTKLAVDLMLDSGAFSAWNRGTSINLKEYMAYIKRLDKYFFSYVNLDTLPEGSEAKRTIEAIEVGAQQSYKNLQIMKDAGLKPIPVFHQGEQLSWLERMVEDGEDYIGVSARKDLWTRDHVKWLDKIFSMLCDSKGRPVVQTHGFGITSPGLLLRYPFHTVDSTTWSMTPGYGRILCPIYIKGVPDYSKIPVRIITSGITSKASGNQKMQFEGMGPIEQECVLRFLDEVGITLVEARYKTDARRRAVLHYYLKLAEHLQDTRFAKAGANPFKLKPIKTNLLVMFATALKNKEWSVLMNEEGARTRLLSYFELKDGPDEALIEYVTTGIFGTKTNKPPKARWDNEGYLNYRRLQLAKRGKQTDNVEDGTS